MLWCLKTLKEKCEDKTFIKSIIAKKWDPGILDPGPFSAQIRKVEARLGKFAKIRKVETDQESSSKRLGKLEVRPKKKRSSLNFGWEIRKIQPDQESSFGRLGKLGKVIRKIRKVHSENQEGSFGRLGKLGKFIRKIPTPYQENSASKNRLPEAKTLFATMLLSNVN